MLDFSAKSDRVRIYRIVLEKGSRRKPPSVALLGNSLFPPNYSLPFFIAIDGNRTNVTTFRLEDM